MNVAILDYPGGNTRSVLNALERLGVRPVCTAAAEELRRADKVIFPGVGAAGSTMDYLRRTGLNEVLLSLQQPVLAICVGMQVLCAYSEEGDTECLGLFPQRVRRFTAGPGRKVPHMGWNKVEWQNHFPKGEEGHAYYVHSYYAETGPDTVAISTYDHPFSAVLVKNNFWATQFHPEKSGPWGARFLQKFLEQ